MDNQTVNGDNKPKYWKSLNVLNGNPQSLESMKHEFMEGVTDDFDPKSLSKMSRRKFMALMGATAAVTATACNDYRDKGEIIPYNQKPEDITPGIANHYASTFKGNPYGWGILIKTREGRPIKIDGNPDHPLNQGKIDAAAQTSLMQLYDPDRIQDPQVKSRSKLIMHQRDYDVLTWEQVDKEMRQNLQSAANSGKEIALVTHTIVSPSEANLINDFVKKYPTAKVYSYELFNDSERRKAWKAAKGSNMAPVKWENAKVILSLESDFLATEGDYVENMRRFSRGKDVNKIDRFNRFYAVEGAFSLTGANADERIRLNPVYQLDFLRALNDALSGKGYSGLEKLAKEHDLKAETLKHLVEDLKKYRGEAIVYAGDKLPAEAHALAIQLNDAIGAQALYDNSAQYVSYFEPSTMQDFGGLVSKLKGGKVGVLIHYDSNPVYHLPYDLGYKEAYKKAPVIVSMTETRNESSEYAQYLLPINHNFESWGDAQTRKGIINLQQPVIAPLYRTRQREEALLNWIGDENLAPDKTPADYSGGSFIAAVTGGSRRENTEPKTQTNQKPGALNGSAKPKEQVNANPEQKAKQAAQVSGNDTAAVTATSDTTAKAQTPAAAGKALEYHKYLLKYWNDNFFGRFASGDTFEDFWYKSLQDGFIIYADAAPAPAVVASTTQSVNKAHIDKSGYTLILSQSFRTGDGRWANNPWMQELPHHLTKVSWDNFAALSPKTAKELNLDWGDMIEVRNGGRKLELPVAIQPGMAEKTIMTELGYGRWVVGKVGEKVGFNSNKLLSAKGGMSPWIYTGVSVKKADKSYKLVSTQEHHSLDDEFVKDKHITRGIIREARVAEYEQNPKIIAKLHGEPLTMYEHEYTGVKWAMAIDLNKCTGCDICSTACSMENNVPVVGKDQVAKGREMSWLRIDRYFSGTPEDPKVSYQPMLCQHCDNAPCENVCPVAATSHSPDGLNQMAYNRCVGTRYCSNNCPYKVRRYNFFDFRDHFRDTYQYADSLQLLNNPEVTVRSRGVMEKCTFCVQRIMEGRQEATKEGRTFNGEGITTACQQACPTDAIIFGNINDPNSQIRRVANHDLGYRVLETHNFRPNITYIARLRNTKTEEKA